MGRARLIYPAPSSGAHHGRLRQARWVLGQLDALLQRQRPEGVHKRRAAVHVQSLAGAEACLSRSSATTPPTSAGAARRRIGVQPPSCQSLIACWASGGSVLITVFPLSQLA